MPPARYWLGQPPQPSSCVRARSRHGRIMRKILRYERAKRARSGRRAAYKPDSVPLARRQPSLWDARYRAPRCDVARADGPSGLRHVLEARKRSRSERSCFAWGLPGRASPRRPVSLYLTISPVTDPAYADPPVCFCGTFLRVTPTGRYPARSPVKPGLSSRSQTRDCPAAFSRGERSTATLPASIDGA